jgi:hypothetical protein
MADCEVSQLHDNISKLRSLQTILLDSNSELCTTLPSFISKLTSLIHLTLQETNIESDTLTSLVFNLPSLEELKLKRTWQLISLPSQISQLTSL